MPRVELEADADPADEADAEDKNRKIDDLNAHLSATSVAPTNGESPAGEDGHLNSSANEVSEPQEAAPNGDHADGKLNDDMKQRVAESGPLDQDVAQ